MSPRGSGTPDGLGFLELKYKFETSFLWNKRPGTRRGGELIGLPASLLAVAHGSRKGVGPGSATSLTQKWCFVEQDNEAFVGPCSQRGPAPTLTMGLKILVRAGRGGLKADGPSVWRLVGKDPISQHPGAARGPGNRKPGWSPPLGTLGSTPKEPRGCAAPDSSACSKPCQAEALRWAVCLSGWARYPLRP